MREIIELYWQWGDFLKYLMPTLNKETKSKASVLKMQLTTEHVFVVKTYYKTSSYLEVKEAFCRRFPEKDPPTNRKRTSKIRKRGYKFIHLKGKIWHEENSQD